ncbi:hypothetical protein OS493_038719, partial [Desmophyllum pertusum]
MMILKLAVENYGITSCAIERIEAEEGMKEPGQKKSTPMTEAGKGARLENKKLSIKWDI